MQTENETPLIDLLWRVPANAFWQEQTPNSLGFDVDHYPVGVMCRNAAARIAALEAELAVERERRDAAEIALRMIRIDAAWAIDTQQQVLNHFARFKD